MDRKEELKLKEQELLKELDLINKEKEEIKEEQLNIKKQEVAKKIEYLRKHKDVILPLFEHSRTTCSDENVCNGYCRSDGYARCNKCFLIEILDDTYCYDDGDFDVDLDLTITKTSVSY